MVGTLGIRSLSSYPRERRYWDPFWVRFLDMNFHGMGLTPFGPLSRLVLTVVIFDTISQSLKEVISGICWLGESLRVLVRVLCNMPKGKGWEVLCSFSHALMLDRSGWYPFLE